MTPFVHLHVHSQYSLLDGQASVEGLVDKAIADGMPGIALTDHGAMFGIKQFYNYVKKKNANVTTQLNVLDKELKTLEEEQNASEEKESRIEAILQERTELERQLFKPILGCEAYCARRSRHDKDPHVEDPYKPNRSIDSSGWHLVILAKNLQGYKNLIKLVSYSWTEGYYYRPRIDKELLEKYHEGLIISSACLGGEIPQHIMAGRLDEARKSILWFKELFGEDYYLELQRHQTNDPLGNSSVYEEQVKVNQVILELAQELGVSVIATNDVHFTNKEDGEAHDRLICLSTGKDLNDPKRMRYSKQEWLKTTEEMNEVFADIPEVLARTTEILDKVEFYSIDNPALMPHFPIPSEFANDDDYLRHLTYQGAQRKYGEQGLTDEIRERINFELDTIKKMGYPGYFLIVQDFIRAARDMGVVVGPGRGSAAGSVVAYSLDITDLDPIKYDLLFERFLNPDRISMPDIDVDFDDDGRAEILKWVTEKYGYENVAHIITYGTMAAKSSLRDVARVHKLPLSESDRLTKLIPDKMADGKKVTLATAMEHVPELKQASLSPNIVLQDTLKYARALEGNVRNVGVHACGIIIGPTPISDVVPISTATDKTTGEDMLVTQYEGSVIEETGLIKMDFLGLKTLSVIKEALLNIKKNRGLDIDINNIPIDDAKTYKLYSEGRTVGTFQFESSGMQRYLRELKPTTFEDLIAMNALYRPGPMEYIPSFINRKHGIEPIEYDLPVMERYLKETYGITVYQEQVMLLSREIAGFTRGQSDNLRKAMGKKLEDKMIALKKEFIEGGQAHGYKEAILEKIWADWAKFASYAFNKSHSACYSWVAYQTAYLKANYPSEYMAGALSRNLDNIKEITKLMDECRSMSIKVLVPDINESGPKFSVNKDGNIRFGLSAIKGVSTAAVEQIVQEREANGAYKDVYDFMTRTNLFTCNKKTLENLIFSGAFDSFGIPRQIYLQPMGGIAANKDEHFLLHLVRYGFAVQEDKHSKQNSLFGSDDEAMQFPQPVPPVVTLDMTDLELLERERNLVGLYLSAHPLAPYKVILDYYCNTNCLAMKELDGSGEPGQKFIFGGIVTKVFQGLTKRGDNFGRLSVEDSTGIVELSLFKQKYLNFAPYFTQGIFVLIFASMQPRPFQPDVYELQVDKIQLLNDAQQSLISRIDIGVPLNSLSQEVVDNFATVLQNNTGSAAVYIHIQDEEQMKVSFAYDLNGVNPSIELLNFCLDSNFDFAVS